MKKILMLLLTNVTFVHVLNSQTLIQQIEEAYSALDSISYIENWQSDILEDVWYS